MLWQNKSFLESLAKIPGEEQSEDIPFDFSMGKKSYEAQSCDEHTDKPRHKLVPIIFIWSTILNRIDVSKDGPDNLMSERFISGAFITVRKTPHHLY